MRRRGSPLSRRRRSGRRKEEEPLDSLAENGGSRVAFGSASLVGEGKAKQKNTSFIIISN